MKQIEGSPEITPEDVALLEERLDHSYIDYLIKADAITGSDFINTTGPFDAKASIKVRPRTREAEVAHDKVLLYAFALTQAGYRDTPYGEDRAILEPIQASGKRISKIDKDLRQAVKSRQFTESEMKVIFRDFNLVLKRIVTREGEPVVNPFGPGFSREVAHDNVELGQGIQR